MGAGLTSVDLSKLPMGEGEEGNVHTGAVPPWLRQEQTSSKPGAIIGPSLEDFTKHLERQKKGKLPPGRVGANFNRSGAVSQTWLPNFGGVWNKGRRSNSRGGRGGGGQKGQDTARHRAPPTGILDPLSSSLPSVIVPYKRRRTSSAASTSTVTSAMLLSDQSVSQSMDMSAGPSFGLSVDLTTGMSAGLSAGLSAGELMSQPGSFGIDHSAGPSGLALESAGLSTAQSVQYWTDQSSHPSTSHQSSYPSTSHQSSYPSTSHQSSYPSTSHQSSHPSTSHQSSYPSTSHSARDSTSAQWHHHHQSQPLQTSAERPPWNQSFARIPPPPLSTIQESGKLLNQSVTRTGFPGPYRHPDQHSAVPSAVAAQGLANSALQAGGEAGMSGVVVPYRRKRKSHVDNSTEGIGVGTNSWMGAGTIVPPPQILKANLPGS